MGLGPILSEVDSHQGGRYLKKIDKSQHALCLFMGLSYVLWLIVTVKQVGIPRDESIYFYAADRFTQWFQQVPQLGIEALSADQVKVGFQVNHEHPMLMKMLFGLSHHFLYSQWSLLSDPILAYRLPTMILGGFTVYLTGILGMMMGGMWVGLSSTLLLMGMPRLFFHAHLSCFDLPVTTMWLSIAMAYIGALQKRRWIFGAGIALGLGLATKLNSFFAPFTLLGLSMYHVIQTWPDKDRRDWWLKRYRWIALSMVILGLGVFWLHWPWLYHNTWARLSAYIAFHARHVHYPVDYLGTLYYGPPFPVHFPFSFTLFTLPVACLCLALVGGVTLSKSAWRRWQLRDDSLPIELFLLVNLMVPILVIALPNTPIFGGTKHWMPSMPFLAVIGGIGFQWLIASTHLIRKHFITLSLLLCLSGPGLWLTHEYGAHGPAWYNSLIGGIPGAAEARMPRNFWGYSSVEMIPWLNQQPSRLRDVFWHNATGTSVHHYRRAKWLKHDVKSTGDWTYPYADWSLYHHQQEKIFEEVDLWWRYGTPLPVEGFFIDGVQQIGVYGPEASRVDSLKQTEP